MIISRRYDPHDAHLIKMQITRMTSRLWWTVTLDLWVWTFILDWRILKSFCKDLLPTAFRIAVRSPSIHWWGRTERSLPEVPASTKSHPAQTVDIRTLLTRYLGVKSRERKAGIPGLTAHTQTKPSFDRKFQKFCYLKVHITINIPFSLTFFLVDPFLQHDLLGEL